MKSLLKTLLPVLQAICPKSRWGNIIYLILGFAAGNYDAIVALIQNILAK